MYLVTTSCNSRDGSIIGLCGAKTPHPTFLLFFLYIINRVIVILFSKCVTSNHNSLSMY